MTDQTTRELVDAFLDNHLPIPLAVPANTTQLSLRNVVEEMLLKYEAARARD